MSAMKLRYLSNIRKNPDADDPDESKLKLKDFIIASKDFDL